MTLFHHIFCWLVPPKSTNRFHPGSKNDHRFRPTLQELISCWLIPPKYGTGSQNYQVYLVSFFFKIAPKFSMCWAEPFFSIKWIQLHTWAEPVKPDDKALLKSHSEFYNVGEYMTIGTGLICGWGLNSAPLIRIGVCLGLSGIYSLPVLFSRICPMAVSLFFSSPSGVS